MKKKKSWILVLVAGALLGCLFVFWQSRHVQDSSNGVIVHHSCFNAGYGCLEYTLIEDNGEALGLSGLTEQELKQYTGRKVVVRGKIEQSPHPPKQKYILVESIDLQ